jgi:hypothetical protein
VIHHDLDWNPSSIEQRTGRVGRLGCKAEQERTLRTPPPQFQHELVFNLALE